MSIKRRRTPLAQRFAQHLNVRRSPCRSAASGGRARARSLLHPPLVGWEAEAAAKRAATQLPALGAEAVLRQRPHDRTNRPKKSPAPLFHVAAKALREEMWEAYAWFVGAFQQATPADPPSNEGVIVFLGGDTGKHTIEENLRASSFTPPPRTIVLIRPPSQ